MRSREEQRGRGAERKRSREEEEQRVRGAERKRIREEEEKRGRGEERRRSREEEDQGCGSMLCAASSAALPWFVLRTADLRADWRGRQGESGKQTAPSPDRSFMPFLISLLFWCLVLGTTLPPPPPGRAKLLALVNEGIS